MIRTVDEQTLVPDESLSIDEGAVRPWQTLMCVLDEGYCQRSWGADGCALSGIDAKGAGNRISRTGGEEAHDLSESDQWCSGRDGFYLF